MRGQLCPVRGRCNQAAAAFFVFCGSRLCPSRRRLCVARIDALVLCGIVLALLGRGRRHRRAVCRRVRIVGRHVGPLPVCITRRHGSVCRHVGIDRRRCAAESACRDHALGLYRLAGRCNRCGGAARVERKPADALAEWASFVAIVSLAVAPLWYLLKRETDRRGEAATVSSSLYTELADALDGPVGGRHADLLAVRTGDGAHARFVNLMFNHDICGSPIHSGGINAVRAEHQQHVQDMFQLVKDHNASLKKIRGMESIKGCEIVGGHCRHWGLTDAELRRRMPALMGVLKEAHNVPDAESLRRFDPGHSRPRRQSPRHAGGRRAERPRAACWTSRMPRACGPRDRTRPPGGRRQERGWEKGAGGERPRR